MPCAHAPSSVPRLARFLMEGVRTVAQDVARAVTRDENLLSRRPWYLAGVLLIVLSVLIRQPLLVVAGLFVIVLGGVPELWYRFCLRGLVVQRSLSSARARLGDEVSLVLRIENRKLLPLPRLEVDDEVPEQGVTIHGGYLETSVKPLRMILVNTLSLWALQRVMRRYRVRCVERGVYAFGPLRVESGDPFGLLTRQTAVGEITRLLVYPLVVPLERLGLPARAPFGDCAAPRRLVEDPLRTAGVRPYVIGDEPRRIHWKATARSGQLQSRVYEPTAHHTLVLFVDARTFDNPVLGYDPPLLELALCAAASIATWAIEQGYALGLYATGSLADAGVAHGEQVDRQVPTADMSTQGAYTSEVGYQRALLEQQVRLRVPPSTSPQQIVRVQEGLARLVPYYAGPMTQVFAREESHLPFGATVVYIGTARALGAEGVAHLRRMRAHGHAVTLLFTGDELPTTGLTTIRLGTAHTWKALHEEALASRGIDGHGEPRARQDHSDRGPLALALEEVS